MSMTIPGITIIKKHPAHQYAEDVLSGKIVSCKRVKQSCQRYIDDLSNDQWVFDYKSAAERIDWFSKFLRHPHGKYQGQPFHLLAWEQFILWNVYGFKNKETGLRRFQYAHIFIAKKNGKTTLGAGWLLQLLFSKEPKPEIYCAASTRDQARIGFKMAKDMVTMSPMISKHVVNGEKQLEIKKTFGSIAPLSADANSFEGINVYASLIDEGHVHKTSAVYNGIKAGSIARDEPMILYITTAGFNTASPCYKEYTNLCDLLDEKIQDDTMFGIIYEIDEEDDWQDPEVWCKANPSIGHSVTMERLLSEFNQALNDGGSKIVNFKTKHLNVWCDAESTWIPDEKIKERMDPLDIEFLAPHPAFAGLDLSSTRDLTALTLVWEIDDHEYTRTWCWIPEDRIKELEANNDRDPYIQWARRIGDREPLIITTPGNATDYRYIFQHIMELRQTFKITCVGIDQWNSSQLGQELTEADVEIKQLRQGYQTLSESTKDLERRIYNGTITMHPDDCIRWQFGNVVIERDHIGNERPTKKKAGNKIDGILSIINAKACKLHHVDESMPDDIQIISF
jgi:phage terminase large subunit-like protein